MIYFKGKEKYFILNYKNNPSLVPVYNYDARNRGFDFGETYFYEHEDSEEKINIQNLESYFLLFSEDNPLLRVDKFNLGESNNLFKIQNNKIVLDIPYKQLLEYNIDDFIYIWFVKFKNITRAILQGTLRLY